MNQFYQDVLHGLTSSPKFLLPKYFYDAEGDHIFQQIMHTQEYYLTRAELEILQTRQKELIAVFKQFENGFDLVELGAGDASKSYHLLQGLLEERIDFTYYPTDISEHVVQLVEKELPQKLPDLKIKGLTGEFFETLQQVGKISGKKKVVLFLGANIGNMSLAEAENFCLDLHKYLSPGDLTMIGFDLKKNPWVIFNAYNDRAGTTKAFNLNLLRRINKELGADFNLEQFDHFESYDPESGCCKSYLFSLSEQKVIINNTEIHFTSHEPILMEISQKYTRHQIDSLARKTGFHPLLRLFDGKEWFTDVVWERI